MKLTDSKRQEIREWIERKAYDVLEWYTTGAIDCDETRKNINADLDWICQEAEKHFHVQVPWKLRVRGTPGDRNMLTVKFEDPALS